MAAVVTERMDKVRPASASASYFSQLLTAAILLTIACSETTTPVRTPAKLAFASQPVSSVAGNQIAPIVVEIQDATGNRVTTATNDVTLAVAGNPASQALIGPTTVAAVDGVATFSQLSINVAAISYALSATSPNLTAATSTNFSIIAGPATKLGFTVQPVHTLANASIPDLRVAVQDAVGNTVASAPKTINLGIGSNSGKGSLSGNTSIATVNGIAVFSGLSITNPGDGYTLTAATTGLTPAVSTAFNVTIGPASKLVFTTQPATSPPGATISPAVAVAVQDVAGNMVTTAANDITVAIGTNAGNGTLSGTTTVAAVNGIATFSDLKIDNTGAGYTLSATTPSVNAAVSNPFSIRNPLVFTSVTAGYFHTCGLTTGGAAFCWGENSSGQLGTAGFPISTAPAAVTGGLTFANVGAGRTQTCGVAADGVAFCWGSGSGGPASPSPLAIGGGRTFASVIAGYSHTCGVTPAGTGFCWGDNSQGELGDGTQTGRSLPTAVSGGRNYTSITPGRYLTCGLTNTSAGYCWGVNEAGELGDGTFFRQTEPVAVSGQLAFAAVSAGGFHACGLTVAGLAYCWGSNDFGQLGNGTNVNSNIPMAVAGGLTFATLSAGNRHTCGVTAAGAAYCWGDNSSGMLGDGTRANKFAPVPVSGGLTFSNVSAGRFHTCGVTSSGDAYCWGTNASGELGDGTVIDRLVPVPVR